MKPKAIVSWSGGKDCYLALRRIQHDFEIAGLLTMMTEDGRRSRSHGLRPELLRYQARLIGVPHFALRASWPDYEKVFSAFLAKARRRGVTHIVFGDIYPNVDWAETVCALAGLQAVQPLWGEPTGAVVREFIATGSKALITTVRNGYLDRRYLGKPLTVDLIREFLETGIDPCGECGEFHTFVTAFGGIESPVPVALGQIHESGGCSAIDLALQSI